MEYYHIFAALKLIYYFKNNEFEKLRNSIHFKSRFV